MKKLLITCILSCLTICFYAQGQQHPQILKLAKDYRDYMFRNQPTKDVIKEIREIDDASLAPAAEFIAQTITTKNNILSAKFLTRPDDKTLKNIYIIREVSLNMRKEKAIDNEKLIDSLLRMEVPTYVMVNNYYEMVFAAVGNKNQPFNLSKVDFKMSEYNLKDDTEKGIFFLNCMNMCGKTIWGYINVAKPMNTQKAYEFIKKFPKFNGQPYYYYRDLYFDDFKMVIIEAKGIQSYKEYYLDKYYETLLYHWVCLKKEAASEKEINDLLLGSILKERALYPYTQYKETLEGIFKEEEE